MSDLKLLPFQIYYGPADDPLHNFYIPALKASVRYDRSAGFFSSSALAVAAEGVAHLIQNGDKIRLLVGAELSAQPDRITSPSKPGRSLVNFRSNGNCILKILLFRWYLTKFSINHLVVASGWVATSDIDHIFNIVEVFLHHCGWAKFFKHS